jgi:hypothetical protein
VDPSVVDRGDPNGTARAFVLPLDERPARACSCLAHLLEELGVERARVAQRGLEVPRLSSAATRALDREEANLRTLDRVRARREVPVVERAVVVDRELPVGCEADDERAVDPRACKCGAA